MRDASKYDFHALRTTFVTLALSGANPMPVEKVIALTGHRVVETVMKHYFKPRGTDYRSELEAAMPNALSGRRGQQPGLSAVDPVETMAAQLKTMSSADKKRLMKMIGGEE